MNYDDETEERVYHHLNADKIAGYLEETGSFASFLTVMKSVLLSSILPVL